MRELHQDFLFQLQDLKVAQEQKVTQLAAAFAAKQHEEPDDEFQGNVAKRVAEELHGRLEATRSRAELIATIASRMEEKVVTLEQRQDELQKIVSEDFTRRLEG